MGTEGSFPGIKWPEREPAHSPPSSAESYSPSFLVIFRGTFGSALRYSDNVVLHFVLYELGSSTN